MHRTAIVLLAWPTADAPPQGGLDSSSTVDPSGRFSASG
jgi:hypothetical protein